MLLSAQRDQLMVVPVLCEQSMVVSVLSEQVMLLSAQCDV